MAELRTVEEHQRAVAALVHRRASVTVPLADAVGRVLAEDIAAHRPLPGFDNSSMDGYAVHAADVASASADRPVTLPVGADIPAGRVDVPALPPHVAFRIMTGALMPVGADAVIPVEATDGGTTDVVIRESRALGDHVRRAGEDVAAGEVVLRAGALLGPAQLALLAALGEPRVSVLPPLRVLVLSTGSELVTPGEPLTPGQIYESNGLMLTLAVKAAGATATHVHFVADDVAAFRTALEPHLPSADLLITSGGVSAGAYEVVKDALTGQGVEFVKVAMQPGMPQGAGVWQSVPVVTVPGNPVSAAVSFEVFARPALRAAMGFLPATRPVLRLPVTTELASPAGRRQFRRGARIDGAVAPVGPAGSHYLRWLAAADCLIDVPPDVTHVAAGAEVDVWPLD